MSQKDGRKRSIVIVADTVSQVKVVIGINVMKNDLIAVRIEGSTERNVIEEMTRGATVLGDLIGKIVIEGTDINIEAEMTVASAVMTSLVIDTNASQKNHLRKKKNRVLAPT